VILVVLPAFNEAEAIARLLERLAKVSAERRLPLSAIVVDDGSADGTGARAAAVRSLPVRVVAHPTNRGLGEAIKTGLVAAIEAAGPDDVIVTMDSDDSHSPGLIQRMVERLEEGSDVVIASRYLPESRVVGLSRVRGLLSWGASRLFRLVCPIPGVRDYTCGYRAYRAMVLRDAFAHWGREFVDQPGFSCMVDILLKLSLMPVVFSEVPMILRYDRKPGASKMNVRRTIAQTLRLLVRRRFGRYGTAAAAALALLVLGAAPLAGQPCRGIRAGRAAAIGGVYVAGEALAAAVHPSDWWPGPPGSFRVNWAAAGGSPAVGQDVLLHVGGSYEASQAAALAWRWACASPMTAAWLGAATAFAVGLPKKVVDGFHSTGFEVEKNLANAVGSLLPVVHEGWPASRAVALKFWYWPSAEFRARPAGGEPNLLDDYTGQRYWVSLNPARAGAGAGWWPRWLGVAVGHSTTPWVTEPPAQHVWYLALDLEFRGLPVRAPWWPALAAVLDQVHVPAPGLRLERGQVSVGFF
jgi:dolichol-phosphate mannosyltransferase